MAIISVLDKSIEENHQLVDVYNLSVYTLELINTKHVNLDLVFIYFLIQIIGNLGFKIDEMNHHNTDNKTLDFLKTLNRVWSTPYPESPKHAAPLRKPTVGCPDSL